MTCLIGSIPRSWTCRGRSRTPRTSRAPSPRGRRPPQPPRRVGRRAERLPQAFAQNLWSSAITTRITARSAPAAAARSHLVPPWFAGSQPCRATAWPARAGPAPGEAGFGDRRRRRRRRLGSTPFGPRAAGRPGAWRPRASIVGQRFLHDAKDGSQWAGGSERGIVDRKIARMPVRCGYSAPSSERLTGPRSSSIAVAGRSDSPGGDGSFGQRLHRSSLAATPASLPGDWPCTRRRPCTAS
jgi:hypothetical protein